MSRDVNMMRTSRVGMNKCGNCENEVMYEGRGVPRQPCPVCGATSRSYERGGMETVGAPTDSVQWNQTRTAPGASAGLNDRGLLNFQVEGGSSKNEQGAAEACERLVRWLNSWGGSDWSAPVKGTEDVDFMSFSAREAWHKLYMQVVRVGSESMWRTLEIKRQEPIKTDAEAAAKELAAAIAKKSERYPAVQKASLTLVIDTNKTLGHTFQLVLDTFKANYPGRCTDCGFYQVWIVGGCDEHVFRLDA